jgi:hypothetical protein
MRPDAFTPIDIAYYFARREIDHHHVVAVCPRFPYARIAIDRYVCPSAIRRDRNFVPRHSALRDLSQLLVGLGVNDA